MVLLRHDLPDGSWHFDWMLERATAADAGLLTFRLEERPEAVGVGGTIAGERLGVHRREYLTYEGEVSGGRGRVTRAAAGRCAVTRDEAGVVEFEAAFEGGGLGRWRGAPAERVGGGGGGAGGWVLGRIG